MRVYVGTSGWSYPWNPGGLEWYVKHSNLNAVELNMSFYSYPRPKQVVRWASLGAGLKWSVKVHRSITHLRKLSRGCERAWSNFRARFRPLEEKGVLAFYLFQLPPSLRPSDALLRRVEFFAEELGESMALEPRNTSWLDDYVVGRLRDAGVTLVSVDAPEFKWYLATSDYLYLRMHGRSVWYAHNYSKDELVEVAARIIKKGVREVYVFFNNNHDMLVNAREMLSILLNIAKREA